MVSGRNNYYLSEVLDIRLLMNNDCERKVNELDDGWMFDFE